MFDDQIKAGQKLRDGKTKLCHYTSAQNAMNMLVSNQFWLRNVKCMNDFSEVTGGTVSIANILKSNDNKNLKRLSKLIDPNIDSIDQQFVSAWDEWNVIEASRIFIGSLSECDPEEKIGKLSMWRAYGSVQGGVCFIFNSDPFVAETNKLGAYSFPVCYYDEDDRIKWLETTLTKLESISNSMAQLLINDKRNAIFEGLLYRAITFKHQGFAEEKEWRIVSHQNNPDQSPILNEVECLNGVPQIVKKIPLEDNPDTGLNKADIPNILHRVIIGPSDYPNVVRDAMIQKLEDIGVERAQEKIVISGIPLRL